MYNRRTFLKSAGLVTAATAGMPEFILASVPQASTELGKVKITDVKTAEINIKYKTTLVKVETDAGIYGLGESFPKAEVSGLIHQYKEHIIGKDPLQVEFLYERMAKEGIKQSSRTGLLSGAIGGVEIALWDLAGKILNVPAYVLLGGAYRDKLLIYHDTGSPSSREPGEWIEEAQKSIDYGFKAMKFSMKHFSGEKWNRSLNLEVMKSWVKILEAVRLHIGPDYPLGIDLHWRYNTHEMIRFADMVKDLNLWYIEDPLPPENADAFKRLTDSTTTPIATGENLYTRHSFRPFIEKQACDIINPDAQKCGGLLEMKKISDWADLYNINMMCHNMCTPLGTIASGHACMAIKTFIALESDSVDLPYWQDIIMRDGPIYKDGYLHLSNKPGFGVELNPEVCREHLISGESFFDN